MQFGPLVLSITQIMLIAAILAAYGVSHLAARRQKAASLGNFLSNMLIAAFVAARLAFVLTWHEQYLAAPWTIVNIRDGGFTPWAGILVALLMAAWQARRHAGQRKPLLLSLGAGALTWLVLFNLLPLMKSEAATLPPLPLLALDGSAQGLVKLANGKPMVVNLWATWCPPCRREMPVLSAAQQRQSGVTFVFANQGEDPGTVQRFIEASQLVLSNVMLDLGGGLGKAARSRGLPTTLFYDAGGHLVDVHLGELSSASLADKLQKIQGSAP
ncbi:TlpA disulfide reductase family protein [Janthinobacterium agaricidamnosum]|nr:TlpA disulfide reductase family protein [Janthinobacterium agaricidamnosum]